MMGRRGAQTCTTCGLLALVLGLLSPLSVHADYADALPAFVSRPVGRLHCKANEELCPTARGSNELHCVDLTDAKTCGGCVTDGEGLDCTSVDGVFMEQCTARAQCTGCRWKHGGMNASLAEPDYLTCSITLTQPVQPHRKKITRTPQLSYAKQLLINRITKSGPLAARHPGNAFAANQAVKITAPRAIEARLPAQIAGQMPAALERAQARAPAQDPLAPLDKTPLLRPNPPPQADAAHPILAAPVKRGALSSFQLESVPQPPHWLLAFLRARLATFPLSDDDLVVLTWFQSMEDTFIKLATRYRAIPKEGPKKKVSNADRFRLKLPPVPPKAIAGRPNKPAPMILPGLDYTQEEIEALGLQNYIKATKKGGQSKENVGPEITIQDDPAIFWGSVVKTALGSEIRTIRRDVMDALWYLLDIVSRPVTAEKALAKAPILQNQAKLPAWEAKAPPQAIQARLGPNKPVPHADDANERPVQPPPASVPDEVHPAKVAIKAQLGDNEQKEESKSPLEVPRAGKPGAGVITNKGAAARAAARKEALEKEAAKGDLPPVGRRPGAPLVKAAEDKAPGQLPDNAPDKKGPADRAGRVDPAAQADPAVIGSGSQKDDKKANTEELAAPPAPPALPDGTMPEVPYANERNRHPVTPGKSGPLEEESVIPQASPETADFTGDERELLKLLIAKQKELSQLRRQLLSKKKHAAVENGARDTESPMDSAALSENDRQQSKQKTKQKQAVPLALTSELDTGAEGADVFEQHVRQAQKVKVKQLGDKIQPERLIDLGERALALAQEASLEHTKPLMAGIAKPRPNAYMERDSFRQKKK